MTDDFDQITAAGAAAQAAVDQMTAIIRPCMVALAGFEGACRTAGMSDRSAAMFTLELARSLGWPPVGQVA